MSDEAWTHPVAPSGAGVLVLAGSSGRVDSERARLFADAGAVALSMRWFGGRGLRPAPHEVPIELFLDAVSRLSAACDRVSIVGTSFGAEAALLTASVDPRVFAVIAFAPTSVVWAGFDPDAGWSSHWSLDGRPVPYVAIAQDWEPTGDPPAYRTLYEQSLQAASPSDLRAATIAVERIDGQVVLVAGGDDQVWPSVSFASAIRNRRADAGLCTTVISHPLAGHRAILPGEPAVVGGQRMARGGTPEADVELGQMAWPVIESLVCR